MMTSVQLNNPKGKTEGVNGPKATNHFYSLFNKESSFKRKLRDPGFILLKKKRAWWVLLDAADSERATSFDLSDPAQNRLKSLSHRYLL